MERAGEVIWGTSPFWSISGKAYPYVGELVCWTGATSVGCATVSQVNVVTSLGGVPTTVTRGTTLSQYGSGPCVRPGTSGGAVADGNNIVGIVNGAPADCSSIVFTPVNAVDYYTNARVLPH